MDKVTQQNAAMVEEATAAGRSLAQQAEQLTGLVGQFRLGNVAQFGRPRRVAAKAEPVRSPQPRPPTRPSTRPSASSRVPAGRNGAAVRKPETAEREEGWQDF